MTAPVPAPTRAPVVVSPAAPGSRDKPAWSLPPDARPQTAPTASRQFAPMRPLTAETNHVRRAAHKELRSTRLGKPSLAQKLVDLTARVRRPCPKGVVSIRAQRPRRFGTTASRRPPDASTRHTSRSNAAGSLVISSACTSITRSIAESASGNSFSSTSADKAGRDVGHFTTPCPAGMSAKQRSASSRNKPR